MKTFSIKQTQIADEIGYEGDGQPFVSRHLKNDEVTDFRIMKAVSSLSGIDLSYIVNRSDQEPWEKYLECKYTLTQISGQYPSVKKKFNL